jgi:hypothetical protein
VCAADFFRQFPRHRKLISINKQNTGRLNREFNFRHDWNSLLTDRQDMPDLLFKQFSKVGTRQKYFEDEGSVDVQDYFPHADRMLDYLNKFVDVNKIRVQLSTKVANIRTDNMTTTGCNVRFSDQHMNEYCCK